jgi:hypothetical protein
MALWLWSLPIQNQVLIFFFPAPPHCTTILKPVPKSSLPGFLVLIPLDHYIDIIFSA